jgi:hypothetical protein
MQTIKDDQDQKKGLSDIRCAIVAPDRLNSTPGYYLLLGKLKGEGSDDMPELIFLTEVEEVSPKALFAKLTAAEEKFRFNTIYTEPYPTGPGIVPPDFILSLCDYVKRPEHIPWIRICSASFFYGRDVKQGVHLLNQWEGRNKIPKETVLWDQLGRIKVGNFEDPIFYAFTALRYLLAGFKLNKTFAINVGKNRMAARKIDARKGLTGIHRVAAEELDRIFKQIEKDNEWQSDIF